MKHTKRKPPPVAWAAAMHGTRDGNAGTSAAVNTPKAIEQAPRFVWPAHHLCARAQDAWQRLDIEVVH